MIKPAFYIASPADAHEEWQDCRLIMEIDQQHFYYVVLNATGTLMALKYYQFSTRHYREVIENMQQILKEDTVLKEKMKESTVLFNWPENCLVPAPYFDAAHSREIVELVHGDLNKGVILNDKIDSWDIYNVYRIPVEVNDFFSNQFPGGRYAHLYSMWVKCQQKDDLLQENVNVIFYPEKILVMVITGGQLQLIQNFEYQTAEDIASHLLQVYQQFQMNQEETVLRISGMIELKSALYQELLKYFLVIETLPLPTELTLAEDLQAYPEHYFSPLLKMAACAS
jgi:hypothetical protein